MSSAPHLENGFTPISNKLFERIIHSELTSREMKVTLAVIRYTNGFQRKYAELSIRFLAEVTGINYRHVHTVVKALISKNILLANNLTGKRGAREICVNDEYELWNTQIKSNTDKDKDVIAADMVTSSDQNGYTKLSDEVNQNSNSSVTNSVNSSVHQKGDKDNKTLNKTLNKTIAVLPQIPDELLTIEGFNELWSNWNTYRKELKKPLTALSAKIQLNKLVELKNKGSDVTELINAAIRNGWQGIWELNTGGNKYGGNTQAKSSVKSRLDYQFNNEKYRQREKELTELYG